MHRHTLATRSSFVAALVLIRRARQCQPGIRFASLANTAVGGVAACIVSAVLIATVPVMTDARNLQAQELNECVACVDLEHNQHYTFPFWVPTSGWGWGDGLHPHNEPGLCLWVHGLCVYVPRGGETALTVHELTQEISDAVAKGDVVGLAEYVNMTSVTVFEDRSAIQVWSCDGRTIAGHVAVDRNMLNAIRTAAAELADPLAQSS